MCMHIVYILMYLTLILDAKHDFFPHVCGAKKIPGYCWSCDRSYKKSIDNSTHFFLSEEVDRVIVGVFDRVMGKSSF